MQLLQGSFSYPRHLPNHVCKQEHKPMCTGQSYIRLLLEHIIKVLSILLYILQVFYKVILNQVIQLGISAYQTELTVFYSFLFSNSNGFASIATQNCQQSVPAGDEHEGQTIQISAWGVWSHQWLQFNRENKTWEDKVEQGELHRENTELPP